MAHYVDSSALVKLVREEPESAALRRWLAQAAGEVVACDLVRTELIRAARRVSPQDAAVAHEVLDGVTLIPVTRALFDSAARLDPVVLRSLDAIHLAAALDLGDELDGLVTYDDRLGEAARANGVVVVRPA